MEIQEFKAPHLRLASDYTKRVQKFLELSRQIKQVATDYDVLDGSLEHLQREHKWFQDNTASTTISGTSSETAMQCGAELRALLQETFDSFMGHAKLIRTYSNLYNERSNIGVSEGFALVNQRDAEVREH